MKKLSVSLLLVALLSSFKHSDASMWDINLASDSGHTDRSMPTITPQVNHKVNGIPATLDDEIVAKGIEEGRNYLMDESDEENELDSEEEEDDDEYEEEDDDEYEEEEDDDFMVQQEDIQVAQQYKQMFGRLYDDGEYRLEEDPSYVHNPDQELRFWNAIKQNRLDEARMLSQGLRITPRSTIYYEQLGDILSRFNSSWEDRLCLVNQLYPSLLRYRCADGRHRNVFVNANQAAIKFITSFYANQMIHDRIIEAAILDDRVKMPEGYFSEKDMDIVKRNIIVASNASDGKYNEVLKRAYTEPPCFKGPIEDLTQKGLKDFSYADGETILTRAMKLGREADNYLLSNYVHMPEIGAGQNLHREDPADLFRYNFPQFFDVGEIEAEEAMMKERNRKYEEQVEYEEEEEDEEMEEEQDDEMYEEGEEEYEEYDDYGEQQDYEENEDEMYEEDEDEMDED